MAHAARPPRAATADLEAVLGEYAHFWLIEKHGKAGEVAKKLA